MKRAGGFQTVGIIGGGNMGAALIAGMRRDYRIVVCEADAKRRAFLRRRYKVALGDMATAAAGDAVIVAVKPQGIEEALAPLGRSLAGRTVVISIAAGVTTRFFEETLGGKARVVRAMPNMPAQAGAGITALCAGRYATKADLARAARVFECVGRAVTVGEKDMDAVTAVSGSGPAYVFLFAECLMKAARDAGLGQDLSRELVYATLAGGAALLAAGDADAATLRARVTSKGGTTQAAMDVLMKEGFERIVRDAVAAARRRAGELALNCPSPAPPTSGRGIKKG